MKQPRLDTRHRDKNGQISKRHGQTTVGTLRNYYGANFARGCSDSDMLSEILHKLDEPSLNHLVRDEEMGTLEQICHG